GEDSNHAVTVLTLSDLTTTPAQKSLATGTAVAIAASPNGLTLAVAMTASGDASVAPLTAGTGAPRTLSVDTPVALAADSGPTSLAFLPSGTGLVVVGGGDTTLTVLDTITTVVG